MSLDEGALQIAANGGSIDLERWRGMAIPMIERLEHIVYNVFPMPRHHPEPSGAQPFLDSSKPNNALPESNNKENAASADSEALPKGEEPGSLPSTEQVPDSQPHPSITGTDNLPPQLSLLLNAIRSSIKSFFVDKPPHTIQRLAELVLYPTQHYKTLPAYLRAVDRVTSVTSSAEIFPFNTPSATEVQSNGLVHPGKSSDVYLAPDHAQGLGSDESLGGALLTPIPWLKTASLDAGDENGDTNALGQSPLPAQTEELADIGTTVLPETEEGAATASPELSDEVPHARGPFVLGVEDMGLQDGKGVEMSLSTDDSRDVPAAAAVTSTVEELVKVDPTADKDGDIVLEDTKVTTEEAKEEDVVAKPQGENVESGTTDEPFQAPDATKEA